MSLDLAQEPAIDLSLSHYMEERALAVALDKATTSEQRGKIERLIGLRSILMQNRESYRKEATVKRHARGEIYSKARVAAVNSMGPTRAQLDSDVKSLYLRQPDSDNVLRAHALTHFTSSLVSQRLLLAEMPLDILELARQMQNREECFAKEWIATINDRSFEPELRQRQQEALALFRTASRPMYLVTRPESEDFDDVDARELGKSWAKLDKLAESLGLKSLTTFVGFDEEGESAGVPVAELLPTIESLITSIQRPGQKFPSKKATISVLNKVREVLMQLTEKRGRAYFEVDI